MCLFAYMCIFTCISLENSTKKLTQWLCVRNRSGEGGEGDFSNVCFIHPVNILFVHNIKGQRGRWRRLLREISWRVFGEVTPCLEPWGGPRPLLSTPSWPPAQLEQAEPASGYRPQAICGSEAASLAKGRVTRSQKCFLSLLLTLRWVELRPCSRGGCCSVPKSSLTVCDPMDCSTPGSPVLHRLLEFTQTHVHCDAFQVPLGKLSSSGKDPPTISRDPFQGHLCPIWEDAFAKWESAHGE